MAERPVASHIERHPAVSSSVAPGHGTPTSRETARRRSGSDHRTLPATAAGPRVRQPPASHSPRLSGQFPPQGGVRAHSEVSGDFRRCEARRTGPMPIWPNQVRVIDEPDDHRIRHHHRQRHCREQDEIGHVAAQRVGDDLANRLRPSQVDLRHAAHAHPISPAAARARSAGKVIAQGRLTGTRLSEAERLLPRPRPGFSRRPVVAARRGADSPDCRHG